MTRERTPGIHATSIMVNTADPEALAEFWAAFLDVPIVARHDGQFVWIGRTAPGAPTIGFQRVAEPTDGPRRLHVDFDVADLEAAIAKAVALGASAVERHTIGDFQWQVMRDPDGNEFCLAVH